MTEIRTPQQERSIEKKSKIIEAGYKLFSEVGYYNTNTAEIAKLAGVSTGIVYGYFSDKRDILVCVLELYIKKVTTPILATFDKIAAPVCFATLVESLLSATLKIHKQNSKIHEALHSLTHTDERVSKEFIALEDNITQQIAKKLLALGVTQDSINEKIHLGMNIIQSFSHEYTFDKHKYINYDLMRDIVRESIVKLFS